MAPGLELEATGAEYDHYSVLLEAVHAEPGVAIVPRLRVRKVLASGELVAPFNEVMLGSSGYYLVLRNTAAPAQSVRAAGEWLTARAEEMPREWLPAAPTSASDSSEVQ